MSKGCRRAPLTVSQKRERGRFFSGRVLLEEETEFLAAPPGLTGSYGPGIPHSTAGQRCLREEGFGCLLQGVCVCVCLRLCVSAGCLCSRAKRRERRVWYASLTSFSPRHQSVLSFLSCLFSTHSSQQIHAHLLWQENQSKCFDTDSIRDPQPIIYVILSTHLWQASQLPNTKHSALNSDVLSVSPPQFCWGSEIETTTKGTLSDHCEHISQDRFIELLPCNEDEQDKVIYLLL